MKDKTQGKKSGADAIADEATLAANLAQKGKKTVRRIKNSKISPKRRNLARKKLLCGSV